MYLSHFGMNQAPFGITPNPVFFYTGNKRGAILEALIYAVCNGDGIIKVTGEVGSGKTMLCRMLESMLPDHVEVIYLVNPTLGREDVVYAISGELGLPVTGKRSDEAIRMLQNELIAKHVAGKQVVLLIEEAQAMPLDTLEEIRLFSNLETAHHKLLQIVMFGQPELDENLALPRMRQLKERITQSFKVPPMDADSIPEYLMFRMRAAGYRGPDVFNGGAIKQLAAVSQGIVRRISILADKALLAAFSENTHAIGVKHIRAAIEDSEFSGYPGARPGWQPRIAMLCSFGLVTILAAAWFLLGHMRVPVRGPDLGAGAEANHEISAPISRAPVVMPVRQEPPVQVAKAGQGAQAAQGVIVQQAVPVQQAAVQQVTAQRVAAHEAQGPVTQATTPAAVPTASVETLQQRLETTRQWLAREVPSRYTVQLTLIDAESQGKAEEFLRETEARIGGAQLHVFATGLGGVSRFGVTHGSFANRSDAVAAINEFSQRWGYKPQIRTVNGIRKEILRNGDPSQLRG